MEINTFIEVQQYSDFDIKTTRGIMWHPDKINTDDLLEEFYSNKWIQSNSGLDNLILWDITNDFVMFLKQKWFKLIKTREVCFSD